MMKTNQTELSEDYLNEQAYQLLKRKKYPQAINLFELEVLAFPKSYDAYDSLEEAYMEPGNIPLAVEYYKKSLELSPKNENAIRQ